MLVLQLGSVALVMSIAVPREEERGEGRGGEGGGGEREGEREGGEREEKGILNMVDMSFLIIPG